MLLLDRYIETWFEEDPHDPRYDDSKSGVCPNDRRFDRQDDNRHWFKKDDLDQELNFNN